MSALDLEHGDEQLADDIDRKVEKQIKAKRTSTRSTSRSKSSSSSSSTGSRTDSDLLSRLERTFDRIVESLEEREDVELASAIRDDKAAMSRGLVSLTRNVKPLRGPLLFFLNLVEPLLAFFRVGRILATRFIARRQRVMAEREAMAPPAPPTPETAQPWYEH